MLLLYLLSHIERGDSFWSWGVLINKPCLPSRAGYENCLKTLPCEISWSCGNKGFYKFEKNSDCGERSIFRVDAIWGCEISLEFCLWVDFILESILCFSREKVDESVYRLEGVITAATVLWTVQRYSELKIRDLILRFLIGAAQGGSNQQRGCVSETKIRFFSTINDDVFNVCFQQ